MPPGGNFYPSRARIESSCCMKLCVPLLQACGFAAAVHDPTAMSCRHNPSYSLVSVNSTFDAIRNSDVSGFTFDRESFEAIRENVLS